MKVESWDLDKWKEMLLLRFNAARKYRSILETTWENNENILDTTGVHTKGISISFDSSLDIGNEDVDTFGLNIGVNYSFKFLRFLHSQLSANTAVVVAKPTSPDQGDLRKADAADRIIRHAYREEEIQETIDQANLEMLRLGSGWIKTLWNADGGEIFDFNKETSKVDMDGTIELYSPQTRDMWIDSDATRKKDIRFLFERKMVPLEVAEATFPGNEGILRSSIREREIVRNFQEKIEGEPSVEILEYYEKGSPINGGAGRHCYFLESGDILGEPGVNPHWNAQLPYHLITFIDATNQVYGKSVVEYASPLQDALNRLDSSIIDSVAAHGVPKFLINSESEIPDEAVSNSNLDYIEWSGDREPTYMTPAQLMGDVWKFRESLVTAIQDTFGINDAMLGIQRREQSAVSQQTSIESGLAIHARLLFKSKQFNVDMYRHYLGLVRDKWTSKRKILVLGKGKAFESIYLSGAEIAGGFDIIAEPGQSLPVDPNMRREVIMLLAPILEKAGMSMKTILSHMKLNDLEGMHDRLEMSAERQSEEFDSMIAAFRAGTPIYIPPEELQEHAGRLEWCYDYLESPEFKYLPSDLKVILRKQIIERKEMAARLIAPAETAVPITPGGTPGVEGAINPEIGTPETVLGNAGII